MMRYVILIPTMLVRVSLLISKYPFPFKVSIFSTFSIRILSFSCSVTSLSLIIFCCRVTTRFFIFSNADSVVNVMKYSVEVQYMADTKYPMELRTFCQSSNIVERLDDIVMNKNVMVQTWKHKKQRNNVVPVKKIFDHS